MGAMGCIVALLTSRSFTHRGAPGRWMPQGAWGLKTEHVSELEVILRPQDGLDLVAYQSGVAAILIINQGLKRYICKAGSFIQSSVQFRKGSEPICRAMGVKCLAQGPNGGSSDLSQ